MEIRILAVEYWIFNQLKKSLMSTFNNLVHTLYTINLINSIVINSLMIQNTQGTLPSKRLEFGVFRKVTKSFFYLIIQHSFTICLIQKYRVTKHEWFFCLVRSQEHWKRSTCGSYTISNKMSIFNCRDWSKLKIVYNW